MAWETPYITKLKLDETVSFRSRVCYEIRIVSTPQEILGKESEIND
jgi:hypothetical protein